MKRLLSVIGLLTLVMAQEMAVTQTNEEARKSAPLKIMTYNLRNASDQKSNTWAQRRPVAHALLQREAPDIVGTQEGYYFVVKNIAEDNPEFSWIGTGRDGGSRGEFLWRFSIAQRVWSRWNTIISGFPTHPTASARRVGATAIGAW